jgi:hypothetical protein
MLGQTYKADTSITRIFPWLHPITLQVDHGIVQITTWYKKSGIKKSE